jgi:hypothetical protein
VNYVVIDGVKPWDGRYEFDLDEAELTTREWGWVKRLSGYLPLTIEDGLAGADPELICAFAAIALRRAGRIRVDEVTATFERFADAPFGASIRLEGDEPEETDAGPPAESSPSSSSISGDGSPTSSGSSAPGPKPSGTPASATSGSAPIRSVI